MSVANDILNWSGPEGSFTRAVPCPEIPAIDGLLYVRKVSAKEVDAVVAKDDETNSRAAYAAMFASDAAGHRIWREDQVEKLAQKPELLFLIERINYAGREHNGLTDASRKLVSKNLPAGAASGSPASCAAPATPATDSTGDG
jgi:hypothetical protein